jgi:hypothetical protein
MKKPQRSIEIKPCTPYSGYGVFLSTSPAPILVTPTLAEARKAAQQIAGKEFKFVEVSQ